MATGKHINMTTMLRHLIVPSLTKFQTVLPASEIVNPAKVQRIHRARRVVAELQQPNLFMSHHHDTSTKLFCSARRSKCTPRALGVLASGLP